MKICFFRAPQGNLPKDSTNPIAQKVCIELPPFTIPIPKFPPIDPPPDPRAESAVPPHAPYPWPEPGRKWLDDVEATILDSLSRLSTIEVLTSALPDALARPLKAALAETAKMAQSKLPEGYELQLGATTGK